MRRLHLPWLASLPLLACAEPVAPPAPAAKPTPARPIAPPERPPPLAPWPLQFELQAVRDGDLDLHAFGDDVFVVADTELAHLDEHDDLARITIDGARSREFTALVHDWRPRAFGARAPDDLWFVMQHYNGRTTDPRRLYRFDGELWRRVPNKQGLLRWYYRHIFPGRAGQLLGVRVFEFDVALGDPAGEAGVQVPARLERAVEAQLAAARNGFDELGPAPTPTSMVLPRDFVVLQAAAAPTGELFALGHTEDRETRSGGPLQVLRWGLEGEAAITGVTDTLPSGVRWYHLAVRSADEAYLAGGDHLLRFDGATWSMDPPLPDPEASVRSLSIAPGGDLWLVLGGHSHGPDNSLWRRPARATAWQPIVVPDLPLPELADPRWRCTPYADCERIAPIPEAATRTWPVDPVTVLAHTDTDVWLFGRIDLGLGVPDLGVVLRTRPIAEPLRFRTEDDQQVDAIDLLYPHDRWTARDGCDDDPAFILLHTAPPPANARDPLVESFVRANQPLTDVDGIHAVMLAGRPAIGLIVRPSSAAAANALVAALTSVAPAERHVLECRSPRILREFDKQTGAPITAAPAAFP